MSTERRVLSGFRTLQLTCETLVQEACQDAVDCDVGVGGDQDSGRPPIASSHLSSEKMQHGDQQCALAAAKGPVDDADRRHGDTRFLQALAHSHGHTTGVGSRHRFLPLAQCLPFLERPPGASIVLAGIQETAVEF